MKKGVLIFWGLIIAVIVLAIGSSFLVSARPGQYDQLAQCIKKQGVIFYGAFWCPHCQRTKALFGVSAKYLPYVECSTADGNKQTQICIDKKITSYPTWVRPDGGELGGEHTVDEWAAFSGCTVDGQTTAFAPVASTTSNEITNVQ
jgi:thiol-disulfide isomerase/thioredoxin